MQKHVVDLAARSGETVALNSTEETQRANEIAAWTAGANDRAWAGLRDKRNRLLTKTDWWVLRGSITDAQTSYRSALRDLPATTTDPTNPTWPEEPS